MIYYAATERNMLKVESAMACHIVTAFISIIALLVLSGYALLRKKNLIDDVTSNTFVGAVTSLFGYPDSSTFDPLPLLRFTLFIVFFFSTSMAQGLIDTYPHYFTDGLLTIASDVLHLEPTVDILSVVVTYLWGWVPVDAVLTLLLTIFLYDVGIILCFKSVRLWNDLRRLDQQAVLSLVHRTVTWPSSHLTTDAPITLQHAAMEADARAAAAELAAVVQAAEDDKAAGSRALAALQTTLEQERQSAAAALITAQQAALEREAQLLSTSQGQITAAWKACMDAEAKEFNTRNRIGRLERELAKAKDKAEDLAAAAVASAPAVDSAAVEEGRKELAAAKLTVESLQAQLSEACSQHSSAEERLKQKVMELETLLAVKEEAVNARDQHITKLEQAQQQQQQQQHEELVGLRAVIRQKDEELEAKSGQLEDLEYVLIQKGTDAASADARFAALKSETDALALEVNQQQHQLSVCQEDLDQAKSERDAAGRQVNDLTVELDHHKVKSSDGAGEASSARIAAAEEEAQKAQEELTALRQQAQREVEQLQSQVSMARAEASAQVHQLQAQVDLAYGERQGAWVSEREALQTEAKAFAQAKEDEIAALRSQLAQLEKEKNEEVSSLLQQSSQGSNLAGQNQSLEQQLEMVSKAHMETMEEAEALKKSKKNLEEVNGVLEYEKEGLQTLYKSANERNVAQEMHLALLRSKPDTTTLEKQLDLLRNESGATIQGLEQVNHMLKGRNAGVELELTALHNKSKPSVRARDALSLLEFTPNSRLTIPPSPQESISFFDFSAATTTVVQRMVHNPTIFFAAVAEFLTIGDLCLLLLQNWHHWANSTTSSSGQKLARSIYSSGIDPICTGCREPFSTGETLRMTTPFCYILPLARSGTKHFYHMYSAFTRFSSAHPAIERAWAALNAVCARAESFTPADLAYKASLKTVANPSDVLERKSGHRAYKDVRHLDHNPLRRPEVLEDDVECAARVHDYFAETADFFDTLYMLETDSGFNYGSFLHHGGWSVEILGWRRASAQLRHILEVAAVLKGKSLVREVVWNWLEKNELFGRMQGLSAQEDMLQGYEYRKPDDQHFEDWIHYATDADMACMRLHDQCLERMAIIHEFFVDDLPMRADTTVEVDDVIDGEVIFDIEKMREFDAALTITSNDDTIEAEGSGRVEEDDMAMSGDEYEQFDDLYDESEAE